MSVSDLAVLLRDGIAESIKTKQALLEAQYMEAIAAVAGVLVSAYQKNQKLVIFGNGGSAADAQHIAAELVGRYRMERRALQAESLTVNTSILTAIANDYSYETIFSRQIEAIGRLGDAAMGISTSGNSPNVLRGIETARGLGMITIGLTGRRGGKLKTMADYCICVPSDETARIQECHIMLGHLWCDVIERSVTS